MSLEAAAALRPDFILDYGDRDTADLNLAERVHQRIGRPYYLIDGELMRMPDALREAGPLLGVKARTDQVVLAADPFAAGPPEALLTPGGLSALFGVALDACPCCGQPGFAGRRSPLDA